VHRESIAARMHARPPQPVGGPAPPLPPPGSLPTTATQPPHYAQHYQSQYQHQQHQQQQPPRGANGTAMPGQMIGPSHPSHPQHAAWITHHHHQQQLAAQGSSPFPSLHARKGGEGLSLPPKQDCRIRRRTCKDRRHQQQPRREWPTLLPTEEPPLRTGAPLSKCRHRLRPSAPHPGCHPASFNNSAAECTPQGRG
jgi:hypothetical protein